MTEGDHAQEIDCSRRSAGLGFATGVIVALAIPAGCILPDYCIMLRTAGRDWCRYVEGAKMWPPGHPELAEPIVGEFGSPPRGCKCFNLAEQDILTNKAPSEAYESLLAEIEEYTRNACHLLTKPGYEHNCYTVQGADAPTFTFAFGDAPSEECFGSCSFINPPPGKDCPEPPDPWACNENHGGSAGDDAGSETPPIDVGDAIKCEGVICVVEAGFAQMLWSDPSLLLGDSTRLIYDAEFGHFVFSNVQPDDVAHALGLRTDDVLWSINGLNVDGPEAGLMAYVENEDSESLEVVVLRGGRQVIFRYDSVP
ncbi:MAG: hypothetical protein KC431_13170 [Myxococcales bacterium]|nr:hypothetical protein [Myxococcales bacterium]